MKVNACVINEGTLLTDCPFLYL